MAGQPAGGVRKLRIDLPAVGSGTVFLQPETGDVLANHADHAIWMGEILEPDTSVLGHDPDD